MSGKRYSVRETSFSDPVYERTINVFVGPRKHFNKGTLKHHRDVWIDKTSMASVVEIEKKSGVSVWLWLPWKVARKAAANDPAAIAVVVHECLHATYSVMRAAGVSGSLDNDEPIAYYLEFVTREVMTYLQRLDGTVE